MSILLWLGYLLLAFIMTTMLAQLFPHGRFEIAPILLVTLLATVGAALGDRYFDDTILSGAIVGAGIASAALLTLFHVAGLFPPPPDDPR